MKILQIVEQAFRTVVEEQDDTILWLSQSMREAGADLSVLLAGHAAYYAVQQKRQPYLSIGDWYQSEPAELHLDIERLLSKSVPIYVIKEELTERGLGELPLHAGIQAIGRDGLVQIYEQADQVWQW
jgi:sulfur relay (sulfurtransferase) DsrF/TusC family protein